MGVLRALLDRRAIGLVTTHNLALADIGTTLDGHLRNVHFQEEFETDAFPSTTRCETVL